MKQASQEILRRIYSGAILVIWIILPYALLQHVEVREIWWIEPTAVDQWIGIHFQGVWLYASFYLLLALTGLSVERRVYLKYLYAVGWTAMAAHMIFLIIPNGLSRNGLEAESAPALYHLLVALDAPRNAFPSLHVALSIVAGLAVQASLRFQIGFKLFVWLWVMGIIWSTIALGQHVIYDVISGALIAVVVWWALDKYAAVVKGR